MRAEAAARRRESREPATTTRAERRAKEAARRGSAPFDRTVSPPGQDLPAAPLGGARPTPAPAAPPLATSPSGSLLPAANAAPVAARIPLSADAARLADTQRIPATAWAAQDTAEWYFQIPEPEPRPTADSPFPKAGATRAGTRAKRIRRQTRRRRAHGLDPLRHAVTSDHNGRPVPVPSYLRDAVIVILIAVLTSFLLKTYVLQPYYIPSPSMENTLKEDDRILVSKLSPGLRPIKRGDIVVFRDTQQWLPAATEESSGGVGRVVHDVLSFIGILPQDPGEHLVKRVIGLGGDTVECREPGGPIYVNGVAIDEKSYLYPGDEPSQMSFKVTVPKGALWVMGDHRSQSGDSRRHRDKELDGAISAKDVVGVVFMRNWPVGRIAILTNPSEVFASVPAPSASSPPSSG